MDTNNIDNNESDSDVDDYDYEVDLDEIMDNEEEEIDEESNNEITEDVEVMKKQFEIEQLEKNNITNDNIIYIVPPNERITSEKMSEYEIAEIINYRAVIISKGGVVYTDVQGFTDPIEMAKKEMIDRKCPLYLKRMIGHDEHKIYCEKWSINEMIYDVKLNE